MDFTGIEAWACRLWLLIALTIVGVLSVFSIHYYERQHDYYNEQRALNKLCCSEILVTSLTRELHCTTISCSYRIIKDIADGNYYPEMQRPLLKMYVLKVNNMEGVNFDE
jgi:hypothetical protein